MSERSPRSKPISPPLHYCAFITGQELLLPIWWKGSNPRWGGGREVKREAGSFVARLWWAGQSEDIGWWMAEGRLVRIPLVVSVIGPDMPMSNNPISSCQIPHTALPAETPHSALCARPALAFSQCNQASLASTHPTAKTWCLSPPAITRGDGCDSTELCGRLSEFDQSVGYTMYHPG